VKGDRNKEDDAQGALSTTFCVVVSEMMIFLGRENNIEMDAR
jgi:hypothetical protein